MPSNKFTCADCGGPVTSQQAPAKAAAMRCHPCRRLKRVKPCAYCGNTFVWPDSHPRKYCSKQCLSQSMQIRPPDDIRVRRIHREQAAPGLNPGQRYKLRDKRIAHVVPLVRGGTNYEGNHPNQVLHHRLRRRSPSPLHTRPIPHQSRAATPTTQTHQHRTLTTDTTT